MTSYAVRPGDAGRVAGALVVYQMRQSRLLAVVVVAVAVVLALATVNWGSSGFATTLAVIVVVAAIIVLRHRGRLARVLARSGYRPGIVLEFGFDDDAFTIATSGGAARHPYLEVIDVRAAGDFVLVRLSATGAVLALPAGAVGADAVSHLESCARTNRAGAGRGR